MLCNYDDCDRKDNEHKPERCDRCMTGITILVSIIAGIVFSALTVTLFKIGFLPFACIGIAVALVVALVFLFVLLIGGITSERNPKLSKCVCCNLGGLFFGIFGTILSGIIGVSTFIIHYCLFSVIIVGIVAFFFAYMLISIFFLIKCLLCKR